MTSNQSSYFQKLIYFFVVLCFFIAIFINYSYYLLPLILDETNTFYLIGLDFKELISQVYTVQHHSPLHFIITKFFYYLSSPFLPMEMALRVPSMLFNLAIAYYLYKIINKLSSPLIATIALCFMFTSANFLMIATQARPYSLVFFLAVYLTYLILNFEDCRQFWIKFTVANILLVYAHYLAIQFWAFEIFLLLYISKRPKTTFRIFIPLTIAACSVLLFWPQLVMIVNKSSSLVIVSIPTVIELIKKIFYPELLTFSFLGIWFLVFPRHFKDEDDNQIFKIGIGLIITLVTSLFLMSALIEGSFFLPRYTILIFLGNFLIFAGILASFNRQLLTLVVLVMLFYNSFYFRKNFDILVASKPWQEISTLINSNPQLNKCLVLNIAGYVESVRFDLLADERFKKYFQSNYVAYPIKNEIVNLPVAYAPNQEVNLATLVTTSISHFQPSCLVVPQIKQEIGEKSFFGYELTGVKVDEIVKQQEYLFIQNYLVRNRVVYLYEKII